MWFRDRRQVRVREAIRRFSSLVGDAVHSYADTIQLYLASDPRFKARSKRTHDLESQADEIRFDVERAMYRGVFLPAHRADYMDLLETLDRVANKAEDAADLLYHSRPDFPPGIVLAVREIVDLTVRCYEPIPGLVDRILEHRSDEVLQEQVKEIGRLEREIDSIQFDAVRSVFRSPEIEKVDKLLLKMVVDQICQVSDRIENVGDRISIIAIKRRLS